MIYHPESKSEIPEARQERQPSRYAALDAYMRNRLNISVRGRVYEAGDGWGVREVPVSRLEANYAAQKEKQDDYIRYLERRSTLLEVHEAEVEANTCPARGCPCGPDDCMGGYDYK